MTGSSSVQVLLAAGLLQLLLLLVVARAQNPYVTEKEVAERRFVYRHVERGQVLGVLAATLKERVDDVRKRSDQLDLVFLIDASASVGETNFRGELNFVRKLLSDFTMEPSASRVAIVTFASRGQIVRQVDHVSRQADYGDKCRLLNKQLTNIGYSGGGTYTYGALMEAFTILEKSRAGAEKVVFLVTDGFSNGGDPRHAANLLKGLGVTIFTFGIQTGNVEELQDIASEPSYAHSYFLNSFSEFETLARKALHRDLKAGLYSAVDDPSECNLLCVAVSGKNRSHEENNKVNEFGCCDAPAKCTCGTASGHYACTCPMGYFGNGLLLAGSCQPCPNGTYGLQSNPSDLSTMCAPCPDANHVTLKIPAVSLKDCICASGFIGDQRTCNAITCPKLRVPENGYFVKENDCNNVVNAACGIRCGIGFHLSGDSIRLCSVDGTWTGEQTQCLLKTCSSLRAPINGRIRCEHEHTNNYSKTKDTTVQPIDTRCIFQCDRGFQLRGSKVRNCLPLSRWDGLKTTCKPTFCEPLKLVVNAEIHPKSCSGPRKLPYGSNCTLTCRKGYKLEGPRVRTCIGRHGTWSKRHSVNRCIDKMRPVIHCPPNMTVITLPGRSYAYVNWTIPKATDNSGIRCNVWSKPHVTFPWRVHLGNHTVKYIAQDISGNRARCSFTIRVTDEEPPTMENCKNSHVFTNEKEEKLEEFIWDEPIFYDNSRFPVKINRSSHSSSEFSSRRVHVISYSITDKYGNIARCSMNLTVIDVCNEIPKLLNGDVQCINIGKRGKKCILNCHDGFILMHGPEISENSTDIAYCDSSNHTWNTNNFSYCSPVKTADAISHEGTIILSGDSVACDNVISLNNLMKRINESYNSNIISICGNDVTCIVKNEVKCKHSVTRVTRNIADTRYEIAEKRKHIVSRNGKSRAERLRNLPWREQLEMKFQFIAKIIHENQNNTRLGIMKLKEKLQVMIKSRQLNLLDAETNREIGKLALNLHALFKDPVEICDVGSVLRRNDCVKCPVGTFHNVTRGQCQFCPFGEYQSQSGSTSCDKCPKNYYTRRTHAKSSSECIPICQPGYHSRSRQHPELTISLAPCISCEIGFYQSQYGQNQCLPCPRNTITEGRAATTVTDCLPASRTQIDSCRENSCLNRATCLKEKDGFSCECRDYYVGSRCEIFVNPCLSSPCSNAGQCILRNSSDGQPAYTCSCKPGYTGIFCETLIDECSYSPCRNGGTCLSSDIDILCTCKNGFEGDFCELPVNHCLPSPCEMNSSCRSVNGTWKCFCQPGYLGLRCNLLPCDWLPCHPNELCVNVHKENADKNDYRCECPPGFTGQACLTRINHCENHTCENDAICKNNLLNYTCICQVPFAGSNCEIELTSDYFINFSRSGTTDYVIMPGPERNITELTVCFWLQSVDTFNYGTAVSYATSTQDNAFTLTDYNGFVLYVNGEKVITDFRMNDGYWHFICVSWENKLGSWHFYVDGIVKENGTFLAQNTVIQAGGTFIFGQEQDFVGGGFAESESFVGKLSLLDIWDTVLEPATVNRLSRTCDKYYGSLTTWARMRSGVRGNLELVDGTFCQGCPSPVAPFKGFIQMSADGLEVTYSCETGYEFRRGYERFFSLKKRCLKHGHWEGFDVPYCVRVNCHFPGYFPRGRIQGRSYMFGDRITYYCNDGYKLRGNAQRMCKADGKWSGIIPFCIGVTCKNLLAPDNGDIEYIVAEHDRDDLSILQIGQQLEFKCNPGYFLNGEKMLTCLQNGTWDFERPRCISMTCPPPMQIKNSHVIMNVTSDLTDMVDFGAPLGLSMKNASNESLYFYGDIVAFSCQPGYKFQGNHNLLQEFKLQCTASGTWAGFVPDCVQLLCPWPHRIENAKIYLFTEGNSTVTELFDVDILLDSKGNITTANYSNKDLVPGVQIKIVCNDNYKANTISMIKSCTEDEVWSGESIYCEPVTCDIENHSVFGLFTSNISRMAVETREFSTKDEVDTDLLENLHEEFHFISEGNLHGDRVILQCKSEDSSKPVNETDLEDGQNLVLIWKCSEGEWKFINNDTENENEIVKKILNGGENICTRRTCNIPAPPSHGSIKNLESFNKLGKMMINQSLTFTCDQGYNLIGEEKIVCMMNGTLSAIPKCLPVTCETPPKISFAELHDENSRNNSRILGSTVSYRCISGYKVTGQLNAQCLATGRWSRVTGICKKISCGKPQLYKGASVQGDSYFYQDRLIYICPGGKFRDFIVCNKDGRWSNIPKCA